MTTTNQASSPHETRARAVETYAGPRPLIVRLSENPLLRGTNETTPRLIWIHEVELAAIREGASAESTRAPQIRTRMHNAYRNGETMAMAAYDVVAMSEDIECQKREDADGLAVIRRIAAGVL